MKEENLFRSQSQLWWKTDKANLHNELILEKTSEFISHTWAMFHSISMCVCFKM